MPRLTLRGSVIPDQIADDEIDELLHERLEIEAGRAFEQARQHRRANRLVRDERGRFHVVGPKVLAALDEEASPWMNALVFDNGFHVHHEKANLHWSLTRRAHEQIAHHIDPRLNARSIFAYAFETYVLRRDLGLHELVRGTRSP